MGIYQKELEQKADQLKKDSKLAKAQKDYPKAVELLEKAKKLYAEIGYQGEVGLISKEIKRLKHLIEFLGVNNKSATQNTAQYAAQYELSPDVSMGSSISNSAKVDAIGVQSHSTSSINNDSNASFSESDHKKAYTSVLGLGVVQGAMPVPGRVSRIELEKKAKNIESKIKKLSFDQNFPEMIKQYEVLKEVYQELGYDYQARKIDQKILMTKRKIEQQQKAELESQARSEEIKKSIAEERAERIRREQAIREQEERKRLERLEWEREQQIIAEQRRRSTIKSRVQAAKSKRLAVFEAREKGVSISALEAEKEARKLKALELERKRKEEQIKLEEANRILDLAKAAVESHEYDDAKKYYHEAAILFQEINWVQQASLLFTEEKNMDEMKAKYQEKLKKLEEKKKKEQEEFEKRAAAILAKKEKERKEREAARMKLPPEIQRKFERAKMLLQKAENLENKGKFEKAYARYSYLLELYQEIKDEIDKPVPELKEMQEKLNELKINHPDLDFSSES